MVIGRGFVAQIRGRDSLSGTSLLAECDEQTDADALPNDELVLLPFGAEETWVSNGMV